MSKRKSEKALGDKERILMMLVQKLTSKVHIPSLGDLNVVGGFMRSEEIQPGDLVVCVTSSNHPFVVGFAHGNYSNGRLLVREIGTNNICDVSNEAFFAIRGIDEDELLDGEKYKFKTKALKAFFKAREIIGDHYWHMPGGIEFVSDGKAKIFVREKFGGPDSRSKPYSIEVEYNSKTTIKQITQALIDGGFGKEFEKIEETENVSK